MPIPFSLVCQCGTAKTRAQDGKGYWYCRHCDTSTCTRSHCETCKKYAKSAVRGA